MATGFIQPESICRHGAGDPNCSSNPVNVQQRQYEYRREQEEKEAAIKQTKKLIDEGVTPDSEKYVIEHFFREGPHLVLKVKYPNCTQCAYEGVKIMVLLNVSEMAAIRWKKIDPHFRSSSASNEAPSPAARFPATEEGWVDAIAYMSSKLPKAAR